MKFTIYYGTGKRAPAILRAALRLSGLVNAERLFLHTEHGCIVPTQQVPTIRERPEPIRLLRNLNVGMVCRLALDSRTASGTSRKRVSEVFRTYDTEFLNMLEHCGVEVDGLACLFGKEAAADE